MGSEHPRHRTSLAIEAGLVIDLLRRAFGAEVVPETNQCCTDYRRILQTARSNGILILRASMNPLIASTPETTATLVNFTAPLHLKHRPIFMVPYEPFDGPYAGNTDAKYFSVGLAQWRSPDDPDAVSAKTWRHVDVKWSRMSEELPLHRVADLCSFMARSVFGASARGTVAMPAGTFEGQSEAMEAKQLEPYPVGFDQQRERLRERLRSLLEVLNGLEL